MQINPFDQEFDQGAGLAEHSQLLPLAYLPDCPQSAPIGAGRLDSISA